jgi:hypothetical protein
MTVLVPRRTDTHVLFWFLIGVCALVAVRGWERERGIAIAVAAVAIVLLAAWLRWRRKPQPFLSISPEEIVFGRLEEPGTVITRAAGALQIRIDRRYGTFLFAPNEQGPSIVLTGFDIHQVRRACEAHGWTLV